MSAAMPPTKDIDKEPDKQPAEILFSQLPYNFVNQNDGIAKAGEKKEAGEQKSQSEQKAEKEIKKDSESDIFVINNKDIVLLKVLPGKPDKKQASGKRKLQPAQKWDTCTYYAGIMAARLKDDYLVRESQKDRKAASEFRKRMTEMNRGKFFTDGFLDVVSKRYKAAFNKTFADYTKEQVVLSLMSELSKIQSISGEGITAEDNKEGRIFLKNLIQNFHRSKEQDIYNFSSQFCDELEIGAIKKFFNDIGVNYVEACREWSRNAEKQLQNASCKFMVTFPENFDKKPLPAQIFLARSTAYHHLNRVLGLEPSPWKPSDSIDKLKALIEQGRPLSICGGYGSSYYKKGTKPVVTDKDKFTEYYQFLGMPPGSHKGDDADRTWTHNILAIGVLLKNTETNQGGWVIYLDPEDASDPKNGKRIARKMSYAQFCKNAADNTDYYFNNASEKPSASTRFGYF